MRSDDRNTSGRVALKGTREKQGIENNRRMNNYDLSQSP